MGRETLFGLNCIFNQSFKKLNDFLLFSTNLVVMACSSHHLSVNVRSVGVWNSLWLPLQSLSDDLANEEDSLSGGDRPLVPSRPSELSLNWNILKQTNIQFCSDNKDIKKISEHRCCTLWLWAQDFKYFSVLAVCPRPACLLDINERSIYLIFVV